MFHRNQARQLSNSRTAFALDFYGEGLCIPYALAMFLPMPGVHDQQVEERGGLPAQVTWHLAYLLLSHWGTRFSSAPATLLTPAGVCRRYAEMVLRMRSRL